MNSLKQFSLLSLFFATLAVAVFCWVFLYLPPPLWATLIWMLALSATISAVVYSQGNVRAFGIGCAAPIIWWGVITRGAIYVAEVEGEFLFAMVLITLVSGCMSICVRRWSIRQSDAQEKETTARTSRRDPIASPLEASSDESTAWETAKAPSVDEEVFHFIEDHRRYWACSVCHDVFISLQPQPACPICGSTSVAERHPISRVGGAKTRAVRS